MTTLPAIESMLPSLRGMAQGAAATRPVADAGAGAPASFAGELQRSLSRISAAQDHAYGQAESFELGKPGVALNDVMIDLQKANIAFQTGVQVRNRLVQAYQEVMNMTV